MTAPSLELAHWWRDVHAPPEAELRLKSLILLASSPSDVEYLKADLPAHVTRNLHELYNSPPAPAFPSIVHGSFTTEPLIGNFFTLFSGSRLLRAAIVPKSDADVAALFAAQSKDPVVIVDGWSADTGKALKAQLESARQSNIPPAFKMWCSVTPQPSALVLVGTATHHLALLAPRARLGYRQMTLRTLANVLHRLHYELDGVAVLYLETSFDQALNPDLASTGLQGLLRALVTDWTRKFDVIVLCGDEDPARFRKLNNPRHQGWYEVVLPEQCEAQSHTVAASGSAATRPTSSAPTISGFALAMDPEQMKMVYGERRLFQEDVVAVRAHMEQMRRKAAFGREREAVA